MRSEDLLSAFDAILRIRINHSYAGFFAYLTFALNQLRYCEANNLFPVVHFGPISGDGPNAFYDPKHGDNTWDYWFEPVAGISFDEIRRRIEDPKDVLSWNDVVDLESDFLWYLHAFDPDSIYNYPYGYYQTQPIPDLDSWYDRQRAKARHYLARYVRIKPHVLAKADDFRHAHLDGFQVIGVHMRGSDKGVTNTASAVNRIVPPAEYFPFIDDFVDMALDARIFLATDQSQFVDAVRGRYGDRVVTRDAIRTTGFGPATNPSLDGSGDGYAKGEEVLIDCLLLSGCDRLLRCTSAVGEYAAYFNENLECVDLNRAPTTPGPRDPDRGPAWMTRTVPRSSDAKGDAGRIAASGTATDTPTGTVPPPSPFPALIGPGRLFEGAILINRDDRPQRLERSLAELARFALDGAVTRMSAYRHENGMYGCSVSHVEAVRFARWKRWRSVLIFEDDIKVSTRFAEDAPAALHDLCRLDWGLFQFGMMLEPSHLEMVTPNLMRFTRGHAAHAFALHERTYDFLIGDYICELDRGNWGQPGHVPFDEYINNRLSCFFEAYGSVRLLISQHPGPSDTWNREVDYGSMLEQAYARLACAEPGSARGVAGCVTPAF